MCRKNTESINLTFVSTRKGRIMFLSEYVVRDNKKSKIIKEQEANGLLSSLGIKIL